MSRVPSVWNRQKIRPVALVHIDPVDGIQKIQRPRESDQLQLEALVAQQDPSLVLHQPRRFQQPQMPVFHEVSEADGGTPIDAQSAVDERRSAESMDAVEELERLGEMLGDVVPLGVVSLWMPIQMLTRSPP